ncbi:PREDICTED: THUMP domain-containing protein 1-like [Rhagoletis zephyria]|uniref:THUMP domain-containing protein 1-like n=1 Tax=Rhagoletis zephyria TaxID=28612 RepID=UPI0008116F9E|nr:PREDICTED: THUMP domain-containing protein 1-like [Rhagoletis zephyria]
MAGKRKKQYYCKSAAKKAKGQPEPVKLSENLKGFLVTCNNKEFFALRESYDLLNQTADKLYGVYGESKSDKDQAEDDIEASIAAEVATLKSSSERRFIQADTKCKNILFIRTNDPQVEPNQTVATILGEIGKTKMANCRHICRFLPVVSTFKATEPEKFESTFKTLFELHAPKTDHSFSVMVKIRNNAGFTSSTQLKETTVSLIREIRPNWNLNYDEPSIMVAVNICQRAGCLSILENYFDLAKYNLVEYANKFQEPKPTIQEETKTEKVESDNNKPDQPANPVTTQKEVIKANNIEAKDENEG